MKKDLWETGEKLELLIVFDDNSAKQSSARSSPSTCLSSDSEGSTVPSLWASSGQALGSGRQTSASNQEFGTILQRELGVSPTCASPERARVRPGYARRAANASRASTKTALGSWASYGLVAAWEMLRACLFRFLPLLVLFALADSIPQSSSGAPAQAAPLSSRHSQTCPTTAGGCTQTV